eukprot:661007-Rhodomonas_salina.1
MKEQGSKTLGRLVQFKTDCFASADELMCRIRTLKPTVLHFGCHGDTSSLHLLRSSVNNANLIRAIASYQQHQNTKIRLAVVNACFSAELARELSSHIDFVIGHRLALLETVAQGFSLDLYHSLGFGDFPLLACFESAMLAGQHHPGDYFLFAPRVNPAAFYLISPLPQPAVPAKVSAAHCPALRYQPDEKLRSLLEKYGLEREADVIAQRFGVETVGELARVTEEDVDRDALP